MAALASIFIIDAAIFLVPVVVVDVCSESRSPGKVAKKLATLPGLSALNSNLLNERACLTLLILLLYVLAPAMPQRSKNYHRPAGSNT